MLHKTTKFSDVSSVMETIGSLRGESTVEKRLWIGPDGRILVGDFRGDKFDGIGLEFRPGQNYIYINFQLGDIYKGLMYIPSGGAVGYTSINNSRPIGLGYTSNIRELKFECVNWSLTNDKPYQIIPCASNMEFVRLGNYETYHGELKDWYTRHGFGDYKESDNIYEGVRHTGMWVDDLPNGFGQREEQI